MIKFDEQKLLDGFAGGIALRPEIEKIVDGICERGYDQIVYLGIGGTWASSLQAEAHIKELMGPASFPKAVEPVIFRIIHTRFAHGRTPHATWWGFCHLVASFLYDSGHLDKYAAT